MICWSDGSILKSMILSSYSQEYTHHSQKTEHPSDVDFFGYILGFQELWPVCYSVCVTQT